MKKEFYCRDIYPDCDWRTESDDENTILDKAGEHGREKHGLKDYTDDVKDKVRKAIREVKAA